MYLGNESHPSIRNHEICSKTIYSSLFLNDEVGFFQNNSDDHHNIGWKTKTIMMIKQEPVKSGVYKWINHPVKPGELRESRNILEGSSFVMKYKSKKKIDIHRGIASGGSLMLHRNSLAFKPGDRGGGVPYFDRFNHAYFPRLFLVKKYRCDR